MATWIVHLRLAESLLGMIAGLNVPHFAVGNIAPDSGIPDAKWATFTPPVAVSHFEAPDGATWKMADLTFYRRYLAPLRGSGDTERYSFYLGYFFHLLADNLWWRQIVGPTKAQYAAEFAADPEFVWEVKGDWYGLDFIYVRDHPEALFWRVFLDCSYSDDYLDFMPVEAVKQRIDYIQTFYQRQDEEIQASYERPYIYLSQEEMNRFVEQTTQHLYRIYQLLWEKQGDAAGYSSALELLPNLEAEL